MSKLNKLLDGVQLEWKPLGDLAEISTGQKPNLIVEDLTDFEYINVSITNSGYCDRCNCDGDTVIIPSRGQGGIGFVGYMKNSFWLGPLCYKIKSFNNEMLRSKFIFYFLQSNNQLILESKREVSVPFVNRLDLVKILIPIPSLEIQQEIVFVLDQLTEETEGIIKELKNEIELRNRQYEYYRDAFLTFKKNNNG